VPLTLHSKDALEPQRSVAAQGDGVPYRQSLPTDAAGWATSKLAREVGQVMRVQRLLFPHDFSEVAEATLPFAADLSSSLGAELHLLHALHYPGLLDADLSAEEGDVGATFDLLHTRAGEALERAAERAGGAGRPVACHVVVHGPPALAILEYAAAQRIDLVLMATHGRRGIGRLVLGSVTAEVVRDSHVPVLVVREPARTKPWHGLERILVPHDTSEPSQRALVLAKEIAALGGATLDLLHVLPAPVLPAFYGTAVAAVYEARNPPLQEDALRELERLYAAAGGPDVSYRCHVRSGDPAREILTAAAELDSELVLLSSQGLTGIDRLLLGSVAERLVRACSVPVLVVEPPPS
jgi:nucleotide-binding universal stress UspA family protein